MSPFWLQPAPLPGVSPYESSPIAKCAALIQASPYQMCCLTPACLPEVPPYTSHPITLIPQDTVPKQVITAAAVLKRGWTKL